MRSAACCAAIMMFLLFGKTMKDLALHALIGSTKDSVGGFIVSPPLTMICAPSLRKISSNPGPGDTTTYACWMYSLPQPSVEASDFEEGPTPDAEPPAYSFAWYCMSSMRPSRIGANFMRYWMVSYGSFVWTWIFVRPPAEAMTRLSPRWVSFARI